MRFVDLFAGMGGFHRALRAIGHECAYACEIDDELRELYVKNFPDMRGRVGGDIRSPAVKAAIPSHDILCAGFPCQPFSKSGRQKGRRDRTRGTLFHDIVKILEEHQPLYVLLENVGNFERHRGGDTWRVVRESLEELEYDVWGTEHKASGGHGLISPHHFGYPHTRERFFIVASLDPLPRDPFPRSRPGRRVDLKGVVQRNSELTSRDRVETGLSDQQVACIDLWNKFIQSIPETEELPSFPIWSDEWGATYPYESTTPSNLSIAELRRHVRANGRPAHGRTKDELLALLPSYARDPSSSFPEWKVRFIRQNRTWYRGVAGSVSGSWLRKLRVLPPSLRKLEWNCKGETRDLWKCILQFRPSGLRAKRYVRAPALVAMTTTQIPILGPKRRFISRIEGLRLQGFPDTHRLPRRRDAAFGALGNAVHVGVVRAIARALLGEA